MKRLSHLCLFGVACGWCLDLTAATTEISLVDFEASSPVAVVTKQDADAVVQRDGSGSVLRVVTQAEKAWPGVTLELPEGHRDLAAFDHVVLDVRNRGRDRVTVNCRVDNPGANGTDHCVTGSITLDPGRSGSVWVELKRSTGAHLDGALFGMRGYPVQMGGQRTVNPRNITQVVVFVNHPQVAHQFDIDNLRAAGVYTPPTAWISDADPFFPFIDALGQYRHKSWPGKTKSLTDLQAQRKREEAALQAERFPEWSRYGGWAGGQRLKATGFFRAQKHEGKWWLVDPEGYLFWSHGIDCVRMLGYTPMDQRESWFESPPANEPEFAEFVRPRAYALKGHYAGTSPRCFSFAGANLLRKYGPDWKTVYPKVIHQRLRSWGLNTIANWSDQGVQLMRRTAYTDTLSSRGGRMIEGSEGYWGKFPDVYDPEFAEGLERAANAKAGRSAKDPWCIGYFSDNEMSWGDDISLSVAALKSPADQPAKRALVDDLKLRYETIMSLNEAWGTDYASWAELLQAQRTPDLERARKDLEAFYTRTAERYFRLVKEAIQTVAPQQLYLGCRFAWVNARAARAAAKHCDVISYNLYQRSIADFVFNGEADVPLIIGEFHFGALDRGMFHTGLVPVANQEARARAYHDYVTGALKHPQFVGTHWFQYQDEPTTGRVYDEENYQIGFVDVADTPYPEMIDTSHEVGKRMYELRLGQ